MPVEWRNHGSFEKFVGKMFKEIPQTKEIVLKFTEKSLFYRIQLIT